MLGLGLRLGLSIFSGGSKPFVLIDPATGETVLAGDEPWNSKVKGYMWAQFTPDDLSITDSQFIAHLSDNSINPAAGIHVDPGTEDGLRITYRDDSAALSNEIHTGRRVIQDARRTFGFSWDNEAGIVTLVTFDDRTSDSFTSGTFSTQTFTRLNVGQRNGANDPFSGVIHKVEVGPDYLTADKLYGRMLSVNPLILVGGGLSLMKSHWNSFNGGLDVGLVSFNTAGNDAYGREIVAIDGATNNSGMASSNVPDNNFWVNTDGANPVYNGSAYTNFLNAVFGAGATPEWMFWGCGERDATLLNSTGLTTAEYKEALIGLFQDMRSQVNTNLKVGIQQIGRVPGTTSGFGNGLMEIKNIHRELASEYSWIHMLSEIYDFELADIVHPVGASYAAIGQRNIRRAAAIDGETLTGSTLGPTYTNWSRIGTAVTVDIIHDGGTDFTPSTGIVGFRFFDDETEINISSAVREDADTVTLTLASEPDSVDQRLFYCFDTADDIPNADIANVVKDNSPQTLPLVSNDVTPDVLHATSPATGDNTLKATEPWNNVDEGYMWVEFTPTDLSGASDQYLVHLSTGSAQPAIGLYIDNSTDQCGVAYFDDSGSIADQFITDLTLAENNRVVLGVSWDNDAGEIILTNAAGQSQAVSFSSGTFTPSKWTNLRVGARNGGNDSFTGTIHAFEIGSAAQSLTELNAAILRDVSLDAGAEADLDLNFVDDFYYDGEERNFSDIVTFTRNSSASFRGSDGLLQTAANDVPRFEYDGSGNRQGLLIENQSTNSLLHSNDFSQGSWQKTGITQTAGQETGPDGAMSLTELRDDNSDGFHRLQQTIINPGNNLSVVYSVFVKAGDVSQFVIVAGGTGSQFSITGVDLDTQTIDPGSNASNGLIEDWGNGLYRASVRVMTDSDGGNLTFGIEFVEGTNRVYQGTSSKSLYVGFTQAEPDTATSSGDTLTSYIATTNAEVTRTTEQAVVKDIDTSSFFNSAGSYVIELRLPDTLPVDGMRPFVVNNSQGDGQIRVTINSNGLVVIGIIDNSSNIKNILGNISASAGGTALIGLRVETDNCAVVVNGGTVATDTSVSIPAILDEIIIGNFTNNRFSLDKYVRRIRYYKELLTDSELQDLTS